MRFALFIFSICFLSAGCATAGYRQATATSARMEETSRSLFRAGKDIDAATNSLVNLQGKTGIDLRKQYQTFSRRVKLLEKRQREVESRQNQLDVASRQYFTAWEDELRRFQSTELKIKSRRRRQQAIDSFNRMFDALQVENESYRTIINNLTDIRRYLAYDLTPESVDSIKDNIKKAVDDSTVVHQKIDQAARELQGTQTPLPSEPQTAQPAVPPATPAAPAAK